jgi:GntR family transcriptional repressor for pyruvate dehydrogenase complex
LSAVAVQDASVGLVGRIVAAVHALIHGEGLRAGDPLPSEGALAQRFGVSRVVVREAFRSLAALRLIDIGTGRRARVTAPDSSVLALILDHSVHIDQTSVQQILDVRKTIELRTVALAALRRTDQEAARIMALAEAMAQDFDDGARVMEHDIAFHEAVAAASKNPLFALIVGAFHVVTRQTWPVGWAARASDDDRWANVGCHRDIAAAILGGDVRRAERAMADHFDNSTKALLAAGIT